MLDFSFGEIALIALVAFLVVGPRDLPKLLHTLGRAIGKLRGIANEFRMGFKDAMEEADLKDVRSEIRTLSKDISYIKDEQGNLQRTYDISDFLQKNESSAPLTSSTQEDSARVK